MTYPAQVLAVLALLLAGAYMALTLFVIRTYERRYAKPVPAVYLWPFNKHLSNCYPGLAKTGRFVLVAMIMAATPPLLSLF
ncbi:MAG: hypothetical protein RLW61_06035 [Gammaproteobacteria bacterium]